MHRQLLQSQSRQILEAFSQLTPEQRDAVIRHAWRIRDLTNPAAAPTVPSATVLSLPARESAQA